MENKQATDKTGGEVFHETCPATDAGENKKPKQVLAFPGDNQEDRSSTCGSKPERQLTTQESLDLITKMIANTRRNFNDRGGAMFLIWGYTTIIVTAGVFTALQLTGSYDTMWLWWALPVIGSLFTWLHYRKYKRPVQTHLDKSVNYVWSVFGAACFACAIFVFSTSALGILPLINILFTIGLMVGTATALTGLMIKYRPVAIGGFLGMAISFVIPLFPNIWQFPIFAAIFLTAQIIPGHMLNRACRKEKEERR